jgi:hypothetical protein
MQGQRNVGGDSALQGGASAMETCLSKGALGRLLNAKQYEGDVSVSKTKGCNYSE